MSITNIITNEKKRIKADKIKIFIEKENISLDANEVT